jgi:hypothetical protein
VTPALAGWLDTTSFVGDVLTTLFPQKLYDSHDDVVQTVVAVVDRVSGKADHGRSGTQPLAVQGISLLVAESKAVFGGSPLPTTSPNSQTASADESQNFMGQFAEERAFLKFPLVQEGSSFQDTTLISAELPLANTLFITGKHSLLRVGTWGRSNLRESFKKIVEVERTTQTIQTPCRFVTGLPARIPLEPLTKFASIESGLGNIVRQVGGIAPDGSKTMLPASQELERRVTEYLESNQISPQAVQVWALVAPENYFMPEPSGHPGKPYSDSIWRSITLDDCTIHRVLAGGGGWGKKAGLISLSDDIQLRTSGSSEREMLPLFSMPMSDMSEMQTGALGDIAKVGRQIQFLIAHEPLGVNIESEEPNMQTQLHENTTYLGTMPSTIDDLLPATSTTQGGEVKMDVLVNHFGIFSEGGVYLEVSPEKCQSAGAEPSRMKLDVPYSIVKAHAGLDRQS